MTTKQFNVYGYSGFDKPELLITQKEEISSLIINSNYLGDITEDFIEEYNSVKNDYDAIREILEDYGMILNPTLKELVELTLRWFDKYSFPYHLLSDFGTKDEINYYLKKIA